MSEIYQMTEEQQKEWNDWVETRPEVVKKIAKKIFPNRLYRMSSSGHRCTLYSISEDGTVTVNITGEYNRILFGRQVFGVDPDTLVECDLPDKDEDLGDTAQEAGYSQEDIENILIPKIREDLGIKPTKGGGDE